MTRVRQRLVPGLLALLGALALLASPLVAGAQPDRSALAETSRGGFIVRYAPPKKGEEAAIRLLRQSRALETVAADMNRLFVLPLDVRVTVRTSPSGPFFSFGQKEIVMDPGTVQLLTKLFSNASPKARPAIVRAKVIDVVQFIFVHEIGHALIDLYDLPVLGKEEDAVDALATVVFARSGARARAALAASQFYVQFDKLRKHVDFWDEHSFDLQRSASILCWVYGSDPTRFAKFEKVIPEHRRARCPNEFRKLSASWDTLLAPHIAANAGPNARAPRLQGTWQIQGRFVIAENIADRKVDDAYRETWTLNAQCPTGACDVILQRGNRRLRLRQIGGAYKAAETFAGTFYCRNRTFPEGTVYSGDWVLEVTKAANQGGALVATEIRGVSRTRGESRPELPCKVVTSLEGTNFVGIRVG